MGRGGICFRRAAIVDSRPGKMRKDGGNKAWRAVGTCYFSIISISVLGPAVYSSSRRIVLSLTLSAELAWFQSRGSTVATDESNTSRKGRIVLVDVSESVWCFCLIHGVWHSPFASQTTRVGSASANANLL